MMRRLRLVLALVGVALFAWLLSQVDPTALIAELAKVGATGLLALLALYGVEFLFDVLAWQVLLGPPGVARRMGNLAWCAHLYAIRMAGEAVNVLTPLAGMGGEPVKAFICHHHYDVALSRASASLVSAKTLNVLALVAFLCVALVLMLDDTRIEPQLHAIALAGLVLLAIGIGGFVLVQRFGIRRLVAHSPHWLRKHISSLDRGLDAFDDHLSSAYSWRSVRFCVPLALGFANWVVGSLTVLLSARLMNYPLTFMDAWIIEAMAQMIRAATFLIPASIGAQEGVFVLTLMALTGRADLGLAIALLRRARELVWIVLGALIGWRYLGPGITKTTTIASNANLDRHQ